MEKLCRDNIVSILEYLPIFEVIRNQRVCKFWCLIISSFKTNSHWISNFTHKPTLDSFEKVENYFKLSFFKKSGLNCEFFPSELGQIIKILKKDGLVLSERKLPYITSPGELILTKVILENNRLFYKGIKSFKKNYNHYHIGEHLDEFAHYQYSLPDPEEFYIFIKISPQLENIGSVKIKQSVVVYCHHEFTFFVTQDLNGDLGSKNIYISWIHDSQLSKNTKLINSQCILTNSVSFSEPELNLYLRNMLLKTRKVDDKLECYWMCGENPVCNYFEISTKDFKLLRTKNLKKIGVAGLPCLIKFNNHFGYFLFEKDEEDEQYIGFYDLKSEKKYVIYPKINKGFTQIDVRIFKNLLWFGISDQNFKNCDIFDSNFEPIEDPKQAYNYCGVKVIRFHFSNPEKTSVIENRKQSHSFFAICPKENMIYWIGNKK
jgi:hypothetical protein